MSTAMPRRLSAREDDFSDRLRALGEGRTPGVAHRKDVARIIREVADTGDEALLAYARKHDGAQVDRVSELCWSAQDFRDAFEAQEPAVRAALEEAAERIRTYASRQCIEPFEWQDEQGSVLGQKVVPLERVGIYVPGGQAAYPSTVLMNAVPAQMAGVGEIVMVSPGRNAPAVLAAAHVAGVTRGFAMGGAHAVAALAFGTETVPRVDKITGPGNAWVTEAKRQLYGHVGIDLVAGPSEIVIVTDGSADPAWIAWDLMAQAEHDEDAQALCIGIDRAHLDAVEDALRALLPSAARSAIIGASLERHGALIEAASLDEAMDIANRIAPEHLHLAVAEPEPLLAQVRHAGAVFLGNDSPEALGDYCAGPNHVLPTMGNARFASPLGAYDFQKRITTQKMSRAGSSALARLADCLARVEGLDAHAASARCRTEGDT